MAPFVIPLSVILWNGLYVIIKYHLSDFLVKHSPNVCVIYGNNLFGNIVTYTEGQWVTYVIVHASLGPLCPQTQSFPNKYPCEWKSYETAYRVADTSPSDGC